MSNKITMIIMAFVYNAIVATAVCIIILLSLLSVNERKSHEGFASRVVPT